MADTAFSQWFLNKKDDFLEKVSSVFEKKDDVDEKESKYLQKSEDLANKEKIEKELDTEVGEVDELDLEGIDEREKAAVIKAKELLDKKKEDEKKDDDDLQKKLESIKTVIDTFEDFQAGEAGTEIEGYQDVEDPYSGTTALSDLQEKESQKALLAQITGYTSPMQRAVDLEKRLTNLVRYT